MLDRRVLERRATGRVRLTSPLVQAKLVNLGRGGFAIETERGLRIGEYLSLSIRSEPDSPRWSTHFERRFDGRVRWCRLVATLGKPDGEVLPIFRSGLEFTETTGGAGPKSTKDTGFIDFSWPPA